MQKCQQFCCGFSYPFQFYTLRGSKPVELLMEISICRNKALIALSCCWCQGHGDTDRPDCPCPPLEDSPDPALAQDPMSALQGPSVPAPVTGQQGQSPAP